MVRRESCAVPADERSVRVSAGAPGSRVQSEGETPRVERIVESLLKEGARERAVTRVNTEQASSEDQPKGDWGGRADHVAAKATDSVLQEPEGTLDAPGVLVTARFEGMGWNTGDPTRQPTSGEDRAYKGQTENARSREGVRGVRSTEEGGEKPLEGRDPALVGLTEGVRARAWS